jgi:hypothetical protein
VLRVGQPATDSCPRSLPLRVGTLRLIRYGTPPSVNNWLNNCGLSTIEGRGLAHHRLGAGPKLRKQSTGGGRDRLVSRECPL